MQHLLSSLNARQFQPEILHSWAVALARLCIGVSRTVQAPLSNRSDYNTSSGLASGGGLNASFRCIHRRFWASASCIQL